MLHLVSTGVLAIAASPRAGAHIGEFLAYYFENRVGCGVFRLEIGLGLGHSAFICGLGVHDGLQAIQ